MGTGASTLSSTLVRHFEHEFDRIKKDQARPYLILPEFVQLHCPPGLTLDWSELSIVYAADRSHQGRFYLQDLLEFTKFAEERTSEYRPHQYQSHLEGLCTLKLWNDCCNKGKVHIETWVISLVRECGRRHRFRAQPHTFYVSRDSLLPVYQLFRKYLPNDGSFQEMFDLMQETAEQMHLLDLEDESFDDYVPIDVVRLFARGFVDGVASILTTIGFGAIQHVTTAPTNTLPERESRDRHHDSRMKRHASAHPTSTSTSTSQRPGNSLSITLTPQRDRKPILRSHSTNTSGRELSRMPSQKFTPKLADYQEEHEET